MQESGFHLFHVVSLVLLQSLVHPVYPVALVEYDSSAIVYSCVDPFFELKTC